MGPCPRKLFAGPRFKCNHIGRKKKLTKQITYIYIYMFYRTLISNSEEIIDRRQFWGPGFSFYLNILLKGCLFLGIGMRNKSGRMGIN